MVGRVWFIRGQKLRWNWRVFTEPEMRGEEDTLEAALTAARSAVALRPVSLDHDYADA